MAYSSKKAVMVEKRNTKVRDLVFSKTKNDNYSLQLVRDNKEVTYLCTLVFTESVDDAAREEIVRSIIDRLEGDDELTITGCEE